MAKDAELPFYVEGPANVVGNLPYAGYDATLQGFLFSGKRALLQAVCDKMLNKPAQGKVNFRVVTSYVFLSALYQPRVQSLDPVDQGVGFVPEIDLGFWILTYGGRTDQSPLTEWKFRWLPVWLFVDSGSAIATGREVFGYPKMQGRFEHKTADPANPADANVAVWTPTLKKFGPNESAKERKLLWLTQDPVTHESAPQISTAEESAASFHEALKSDKELIGSGLQWESIAPPMLSWLQVEMPMVFLKQFRDATQVRRACYQSITAVSVKTTEVQSVGFFPSAPKLSFDYFTSHPIEEILGIKNGAEPSFSFWAKQDFEVGFGETIWQA